MKGAAAVAAAALTVLVCMGGGTALASTSAKSRNSVIVFVRTTSTAQHLGSVRPDGTHIRLLETPRGIDTGWPALARHGARLAFAGGKVVSGKLTNPKIYVSSPTGRDARGLTMDAANETCPAWSPYGRTIIALASLGDRTFLRLIGIDGSVADIPSDPATALSCASFLDDSTLLVARMTPPQQHPAIWAMHRDGSNARVVASVPGCNAVNPQRVGRRNFFSFLAGLCAGTQAWAVDRRGAEASPATVARQDRTLRLVSQRRRDCVHHTGKRIEGSSTWRK